MNKLHSVDWAIPIQVFRKPLTKRLFYACVRWGWLWIFIAVLALTGCVDMAAEDATAASLRDALAQAQQERPELWTPERKARADRAVGLVAKGVQP